LKKSKRIVNKTLIQVISKSACVVCGKHGVDVHHVKSKKSGGDDVYSNLMPLCREHHQEVHKIGLSKFSDKYPRARNWLLHYFWEFSNIFMRWIQPRPGGVIL
jgi:5-methylcytosine-specific restriction endonuclease McrA